MRLSAIDRKILNLIQENISFNLWVVFLCLEKKKLRDFLYGLAKQVGRENILNLPTKRQFKLKTILKI